MTTKKLIRCRAALERLETQLKSGVKPANVDGKDIKISLTEHDSIRIKKEIGILKVKLKI